MHARDRETYYKVLDGLHASGVTNMFVFGAAPYLRKQFPKLIAQEARSVTLEWMQTFAQRQTGHTLNLRAN